MSMEKIKEIFAILDEQVASPLPITDEDMGAMEGKFKELPLSFHTTFVLQGIRAMIEMVEECVKEGEFDALIDACAEGKFTIFKSMVERLSDRVDEELN